MSDNQVRCYICNKFNHEPSECTDELFCNYCKLEYDIRGILVKDHSIRNCPFIRCSKCNGKHMHYDCDNNMCSNCGLYSHTEDICLEQKCNKCGSFNHIDCLQCEWCKQWGHTIFYCRAKWCDFCNKMTNHESYRCRDKYCTICGEWSHIYERCKLFGQCNKCNKNNKNNKNENSTSGTNEWSKCDHQYCYLCKSWGDHNKFKCSDCYCRTCEEEGHLENDPVRCPLYQFNAKFLK